MMIDELTIQKKYQEFQEAYAGRQIDDYKTFVASRVIEFFLNHSLTLTDDLVVSVREALESKQGCRNW